MTDRPPCSYEREASYDYSCAKTHCPRCGAHEVHRYPEENAYRCQLEGGCVKPLEAFD